MLMDTRRRSSRPGGAGLPLAELSRLAERTFRPDDVPAVRRFAKAFATRAGLRPARIADFVLAASEATACAIAWGPCVARVRFWMTGRHAFCEVRGDAMIMRRATHCYAWHSEEAELRRRVLRQVCDYVSVASGPDGAWVLLSMSVDGG
jgi:hypothetical protein